MASPRSVIFLLLALGALETATACDLTAFQQCLVPFQEFDTNDGAGLLKYYNDAAWDNLCKVYAGVDACAVDALNGCGKNAEVIWEIAQNAYGYLCSSEGRNGYKKHAVCLSKTGVAGGGTVCNAALLKAQLRLNEKISTGEFTSSEFKKESCSVFNGYSSCVYKLVSSECGQEPAQWLRKWIHKLLQPSADLIDCTLAGCAATQASLVLVALSSLMYYLLQ